MTNKLGPLHAIDYDKVYQGTFSIAEQESIYIIWMVSSFQDRHSYARVMKDTHKEVSFAPICCSVCSYPILCSWIPVKDHSERANSIIDKILHSNTGVVITIKKTVLIYRI